ncbi:MAG: HAD-IA family hydrolase [Acidobacteriota bacterium]
MRFSEPSRGPQAEPLEAVTFDVTHTLIHAPRLAEIYGEVLRRHGLTAPTARLRRRIPLVWQELSCQATPAQDRFTAHAGGPKGFWHRFLERLCEHLDLEPPTRFASAELYDRFGHAEAWEIYPDVPGTLAALRRKGLRIGIVSNWDHRLPDLLERLGLAPELDAVVYSSSLGVEKPHPSMFLSCLEALGVEPEHALHVGDSAIEDAEGAQAVGMHSLRVDRQGGGGDLWSLIQPLLGADGAEAADLGNHGDRHAHR